MINLFNDPAVGAPAGQQEEIVLKPVNLLHLDGRNETAYVQDLSQQSPVRTTAHRVHRHLIIIYLIVGTIAISVSAYATVSMLRKK